MQFTQSCPFFFYKSNYRFLLNMSLPAQTVITKVISQTLIFLGIVVLLTAPAYASSALQLSREGKNKNTTGSNLPKIQYPEMVYVQGGTFTMGCTDTTANACPNNETPAHKVHVNSFYISKYLVTVKDFRKFINATGYRTTAEVEGTSITVLNGAIAKFQKEVTWEYDAAGEKRDSSQDDQPVVHVSWNDAKAYCSWLSKETGKKFRLPAEAEWEFAARGGNKSKGYRFSGGNNYLDIGWFTDNSGNQTHDVGQKKANELGLYDMNGNVWEWVSDWYNEAYYATSPVDNPKGPLKGQFKLMRGGSWNNYANVCGICFRNYQKPDSRKGTYGFRIAADSLDITDLTEQEAASPSANKKRDTVYDYDVDRIALQTPVTYTKSTQQLADYFVSKFHDQTQRARAIFIWVTENVDYDLNKMFDIQNGVYYNSYTVQSDDAQNTLKIKRGVCWDYACLFSDIANKAGLNSFVILGIAGNHSFTDYIGHAWCATEIDSKWYLMDPTWGAGYSVTYNTLKNRQQFKRRINNFFFMAPPEELITTHMPYDPMWEFLNYPITRDEGYDGNFAVNKNKPYFNYTDTLNKYIDQSPIDRLKFSYIRIKNNGVIDSATVHILRNYKNEIVHRQGNKVLNLYTNGFNLMNNYYSYKDHRFIPKKPNAEIKKMLDDAQNSLTLSEELLVQIEEDAANKVALSQLKMNMDDLKIKIQQEQDFLQKYFKTGKFN